MEKSKNKYFTILKVLALVALCCTVVLWIALWVASATPGSVSGSNTDKVTGILDDKFDLEDKVGSKNEIQKIALTRKYTTKKFCGDTETLSVSILPTEFASVQLEYSSSDNDVASVDNNGVVTYNKVGEAKIIASYTQKINGKTICVKGVCKVSCQGEKPKENMNLSFSSGSVNPSAYIKQVGVGRRVQIVFNYGNTRATNLTYVSSDPQVAAVHGSYLYSLAPGEVVVTANYGRNRINCAEIRILPDSDAYIPVTFAFYDNIDSLNMEHGYCYSIGSSIIRSITAQRGDSGEEITVTKSENPAIYDKLISLFRLESSNSGILSRKGNYLVTSGYGSVTLTITSPLNPNIRVKKQFDVKSSVPKKIEIIGNRAITPHSEYVYTAEFSPVDYKEQNRITWSVIKGKAKISETGKLTASMYGKIVIRCQSADYPEVYTDLEIKSRLFVTAYGFVRKFMGHGLLSALLGFGIFGSALMLLKRKWIAFPLTALSSCVYAVGSEFIQYFTPQRYCSLSDIVIDTIGAIGGMLVAAIIVAFICVVWKAVSSSSFSKLKTQFYRINLKTVFPHKNKNRETNLNNN